VCLTDCVTVCVQACVVTGLCAYIIYAGMRPKLKLHQGK